jgi:hypothetical protein
VLASDKASMAASVSHGLTTSPSAQPASRFDPAGVVVLTEPMWRDHRSWNPRGSRSLLPGLLLETKLLSGQEEAPRANVLVRAELWCSDLRSWSTIKSGKMIEGWPGEPRWPFPRERGKST